MPGWARSRRVSPVAKSAGRTPYACAAVFAESVGSTSELHGQEPLTPDSGGGLLSAGDDLIVIWLIGDLGG
jgi:hypothetical protein